MITDLFVLTRLIVGDGATLEDTWTGPALNKVTGSCNLW